MAASEAYKRQSIEKLMLEIDSHLSYLNHDELEMAEAIMEAIYFVAFKRRQRAKTKKDAEVIPIRCVK